MKKNKPILRQARLFIVTAFMLLMSNLAFAQALSCSNTATIPSNGTFTVNGVTITSSSTGDVVGYYYGFTTCTGHNMSSGSLHVGETTAWSLTLNFNKPVNHVVLLIGATGHNVNENFKFNSNGGTVSIYSDSPSSCKSTINGNEIVSGQGASSSIGGGGIFRISAPNNFTTLTLNGAGGDDGSLIGFCSSSIIVAPPAISSIAPATQSVCLGVAPSAITVSATGAGSLSYKWYKNSANNTTSGSLISGAISSSYTPVSSSVVDTSYYYAVVTDANGSTTSSTAEVKTITCCNAGTAQVPLTGSTISN